MHAGVDIDVAAAAAAAAPRLAADSYAAARKLSDKESEGATAKADELQDERTKRELLSEDDTSTTTSLKKGHERLDTWRTDKLAAEIGARRPNREAAFERIFKPKDSTRAPLCKESTLKGASSENGAVEDNVGTATSAKETRYVRY